MKTAVIYARYSSASQTEQSIEGQLRVCNKYAEANGLTVVQTYIDRATTGTNDNRAAFQQMLSDSERNSLWEVVLVYAIDRFGRNSVEVAINKQRLKNNGQVLISATQRTSDNLDGTKNLDGILLENVYIGIAEYYSAELSQKIMRGLRESRSKGLFCGGKLPYGYYVKDKKICVDEEKAAVVRYVFEQYAAGTYVPEIIRHLHANGIYHNGKPFEPNNLYGILVNERYTGIYRVNGEVYRNMYPQIVSAEIFEKVRLIAEKNKPGSRSVKTVYMLRNKVICGYCGCPISAECGTSHDGTVVRYYKCIGRKKHRNGCSKEIVRKETLEDLVIENVVSAMNDKKIMTGIVQSLLREQTKQAGEQVLLNMLFKEHRQTQTALNNIVAAIERGIISDTTNKRLHELETRLRELDEKIAVEQNKTIPILSEKDILTYYSSALENEPRLIVSLLVKRIVLYDDKIEIFFKSPLEKSPDENRGFCFYKTDSSLPYTIPQNGQTVYSPITVCLYI